MTFTWQGRELLSVTKNGKTVNYTYDSNGQRTSKTVDGETTDYYVVDGVRIGEHKAGRDILYMHDEKGDIYGICYDGITHYFVQNVQGDIIGILNTTGTLVAKYEYDDAWGNVRAIPVAEDGCGHSVDSPDHIAHVNPFRYRGYYYDAETGFYYLSSRYYDPEVGRFINEDRYIKTPTGSLLSTNMFAYCENNPVNKFDPTGGFALTAVATAALGGIALWKIGLAALGTIAAGALVYVATDTFVKNPPVMPTYSLPKVDTKSKAKSEDKTKDIAPAKPRRDPVHHIVAKADPRAAESRKILRDVGIEPVTDPRNLVVLPQSYHVSLHTTAYHNYVTERLQAVAGDKAGVEATLASLKTEILARSAEGIRWD